jgi:hypothetical protein
MADMLVLSSAMMNVIIVLVSASSCMETITVTTSFTVQEHANVIARQNGTIITRAPTHGQVGSSNGHHQRHQLHYLKKSALFNKLKIVSGVSALTILNLCSPFTSMEEIVSHDFIIYRLIAFTPEIDCDQTAMGLPPVTSAVLLIGK